jgi:hypothetical protein
MEMSQCNTCIAILSKQKCAVFFNYKNKEQKVQTGVVWEVGIIEGEDIRKGCGRMNMMEILFTHVCKWKNDACGNYSGNGGQVKGE